MDFLFYSPSNLRFTNSFVSSAINALFMITRKFSFVFELLYFLLFCLCKNRRFGDSAAELSGKDFFRVRQTLRMFLLFSTVSRGIAGFSLRFSYLRWIFLSTLMKFFFCWCKIFCVIKKIGQTMKLYSSFRWTFAVIHENDFKLLRTTGQKTNFKHIFFFCWLLMDFFVSKISENYFFIEENKISLDMEKIDVEAKAANSRFFSFLCFLFFRGRSRREKNGQKANGNKAQGNWRRKKVEEEFFFFFLRRCSWGLLKRNVPASGNERLKNVLIGIVKRSCNDSRKIHQFYADFVEFFELMQLFGIIFWNHMFQLDFNQGKNIMNLTIGLI